MVLRWFVSIRCRQNLRAKKAIVDTSDIIILHFGGNDLGRIGLNSIRFQIFQIDFIFIYSSIVL